MSRRTLTPKQTAHVVRVTTDRLGAGQFHVPADHWRTAFAFTAWDLYKV